jgi:hypothetical protein
VQHRQHPLGRKKRSATMPTKNGDTIAASAVVP